ncbi:unnamed protein product [Paramecium pentaurelia]|uniref:Uncharacterized protein n=1 Tax=Paramecium pentaurelia TaxID=43138 RepID=A0A8S1UR29_9CILI|nr:unnamed protein product [Paramecium pentaurelia]
MLSKLSIIKGRGLRNLSLRKRNFAKIMEQNEEQEIKKLDIKQESQKEIQELKAYTQIEHRNDQGLKYHLSCMHSHKNSQHLQNYL